MQLIDEAYLEWIRQQRCIVPGCKSSGPCHAHHVLSRGAGRNDYLTVPLCPPHDTGRLGVHTLGRDTFQERYGLDFKEAVFGFLVRYVRLPG